MSPLSTSKVTSDTAARPPKDFEAPAATSRAVTALLPGLKRKLRRRTFAPRHTRKLRQADHEALGNEHDREQQQKSRQHQGRLLAVHCDQLVGVQKYESSDQSCSQFAPSGEGDPDDRHGCGRKPHARRGDELPPGCVERAAQACEGAADAESREAILTDVVSKKLRALLVFTDRNDHITEARIYEHAQGEVDDHHQRHHKKVESRAIKDEGMPVPWNVERLHALHAIEAIEASAPNLPYRTCGLAEKERQHKRRGQRDDAEEHASNAAPNHEVAKDGRRRAGQQHREPERLKGRETLAAEIDRDHAVAVSGKTEKEGL